MTRAIARSYFFALGATLAATPAFAQAAAAAAAVTAAPLPPATKLEAFKPAAGTVVTFGYNNLGAFSGIAVDAREVRDTKGAVVRGVVVQISQGEYREERAFIDTDELPELIKGIDALLGVRANPTSFQNFEVRYTTKGELQITAFNSAAKIRYGVQVGRLARAQSFIDEDGLRKLRAMFETAAQQLGAQGKN